MPTTRHLVTGATGFVGGALVLELLSQTHDDVVALVRPGPEGATARLRASIGEAALAYGLDPAAVPFNRLQAVAGDIAQPRCGADDAIGRADVLWHSAASLRYEDRYADEIRATNVDGTRHVLALARHAGVEVANMIGTAYVVGRAQGHLAEVPVTQAHSNNHYERSKVEAEALALGVSGMKVRIFRPGIVVGHSRTCAATTFSGLYGFTRQMFQFRGVMARMQASLLAERPLRLRVSPDAPLGLVPIDAVAEQAVHVGLQPSAHGVYHLTQPDPPAIGESITTVTRALGFADPEFVAPDVPLDWLDEQLDKRLEFYGSYIRGEKRFDRARIDAALGDRLDLIRPLPPVADLVAWYLERLEAERGQRSAGR